MGRTLSEKISRVVLGIALMLMMRPPQAHAYDFEISARSEVYGYQLRRYDEGGVVFLNRRRITQMLGLRVYNLFGTGRARLGAGSERAPARIYLRTMVRFFADFGDYAEHPEATPELRNNRFEILVGSLEGRNLFGFLDFSLGRQYDMEIFDFFAYDGFRLRLQGPQAFFIETYGGTQVDRARPFSPAVFETDGTAGDSDDDTAWSPTFGVAVGIDLPSRFTCRLAYRGVASRAVAGKPSEEAPVGKLPPSWAMDQEVLFGGLSVTLPGVRTRVAASTRYNLLTASWDELSASVAQTLGPGQRFDVEVLRSRPHFDGDSIFNVFATEAFHEVAGRYSLRPLDGLLLELRAGYRWMWRGENDAASPGSLSLGLTTTWRTQRFWATGDLFWLEGRSGRRLGGELSTRWLSPRWIFGRRLGVEGRLSLISFADGEHPLDETITTLGFQGGVSFRLLSNVRWHFTVEDNVSRLYRSALRVLAVIDMDFSP